VSRTQIATRVTDGQLREIESYADEHDLTQAEAMRQLLDAGLDLKNGRADVPADKIRSDLNEIQQYLEQNDKSEDESDDEDKIVTRRAQGLLTITQAVLIAITLIITVLIFNSGAGL
jgi:hypothetical protein